MKECPYCKSEIRDDVLKCPICREWINPWGKGGPRRWSVLGIMVFILFWGGLQIFSRDTISDLEAKSEAMMASPQMQIVSSQKIGTKNELAIIGQVKNIGAQPIRGVNIEASFYDKENKLVNVGDTYLSGSFPAGETRSFKIKFGCKDHPGIPGDYDHYTIFVR